MLQTLKLNNKEQRKSSFYEEKSLVGLTPGNTEWSKTKMESVTNFYKLNVADYFLNPENLLNKNEAKRYQGL